MHRDYVVYFQWVFIEVLVVFIALDILKLYTKSKLLMPLRLWLLGNVIWRSFKTLLIVAPMTLKIIQGPWFPNCSTFDMIFAAFTVISVVITIFISILNASETCYQLRNLINKLKNEIFVPPKTTPDNFQPDLPYIHEFSITNTEYQIGNDKPGEDNED